MAQIDAPVHRARASGPGRRWLSIALLSLPRAPFSYPFYVAAPFLLIDPRDALRTIAPFLGVLGLLFVVALRAQVSPTAFVIECALLAPFLLSIFGLGRVRLMVSWPRFIRTFNLVALVLSLINMAITQGFPLRLPYIDFLPDFYAGLYGPGGARIVTMIGFFGLFAELTSPKRRMVAIVIALLNFVVPSSLITDGIGFACLGLLLLRRVSVPALVLLAAVVPAVTSFAVERYAVESRTPFTAATGYQPKVFAYVNLVNLWREDPVSIVTGVGAGQYASEPQQWVSLSGALSMNKKIDVPGLFQAEPAKKGLFDRLGGFLSNKWALNSSLNKPFTSLSTMIAEWGVPLTLAFWVFLFRGTVGVNRGSVPSVALFIFVSSSLVVDQWHDDPWFSTMLLLTLAHLRLESARKRRRSQPPALRGRERSALNPAAPNKPVRT